MGERRAYRRYSKEFKLEAIRQMTTSNKPITQLARELDVRVNQLYKWKAQQQTKDDSAFPGRGRKTGKEAEIGTLRREIKDLREENEILKKAAQYFASQSR